MADGSKLEFGHVAAGLATGKVQPGQVIGQTGANVGDSTGAVTLVMYQNAAGQYLDPATLLDPIWKGTTFSQIGSTLGAAAEDLAGLGISHSAALDTQFPGAKSAFVSYFGRLPTDAELTAIATAGGPNQDVISMEDYVRSLPSHMAGIAIGIYSDLRKTVDNASLTALGHAGSDAVVKELYDAKTTSPADVKYWYQAHSPNQVGIDDATYNAAYLANAAHTQAIYGDNPPPNTVISQIQANTPATPAPSDQAQTAASAPLPATPPSLSIADVRPVPGA